MLDYLKGSWNGWVPGSEGRSWRIAPDFQLALEESGRFVITTRVKGEGYDGPVDKRVVVETGLWKIRIGDNGNNETVYLLCFKRESGSSVVDGCNPYSRDGGTVAWHEAYTSAESGLLFRKIW
jgi:hypothetical protein